MNDKSRQKFWSKVDGCGGECWVWRGAKTPKGYGVVTVDKKQFYAHRISYEFTFGSIPVGLLVCHHCDNPPCVNPSHLFTGTAQDNADDAVKKGRLCIIKNDQVENIRSMYESMTTREIGEKYGVSMTPVLLIMARNGIPRRKGGQKPPMR